MKMKATERAVAALALIALMAGCSVFGALIPVSGLSLNKSADTIAVGSSDNLRVTISPSFAADPGLSWTSSEPSVASVSSGGLVTGKASGSSTVTVSAPGGGIKASCVVTVVPVVYAVGSMSGNLYEINVTSGMASLSSLVSTGKNASGEVLYAGGKGFIAVASDGTGNNIPGLYTFDPSKPALGCALVGTSISAQFLWISSATTGYVTSALYGSTDPGSDAVWSFNPSLPNAGITKIANLSYPQEVIQGSDGKVYIAELNKKTVARLNAVSGAIEAEIPCVSYGTTGLLSGEFNGNQGVFVANTGYDSSYTYHTGSLEFIQNGSTTSSIVISGYSITRVAAFSPTLLVLTGAKTWTIDLSTAAPTPVVAEVLCDGTSFGGGDIAMVAGKAYIASYSNTVYAFDPSRFTIKISVGPTTEMITNVGAAQ